MISAPLEVIGDCNERGGVPHEREVSDMLAAHGPGADAVAVEEDVPVVDLLPLATRGRVHFERVPLERVSTGALSFSATWHAAGGMRQVARMPYFSFLSVLHLYETLGFWRRADYLKVHFAQTMNEFHHLLIMEAMGGDKKFADRFFAQHMAVAYYGMTCLVYLASPRMAYNLSEQVEAHAYHTYDTFLKRNETELKAAKPPAIARKYYAEGDLFLFDEFQTGDPTAVASACAERRRPVIENLYDVFVNVRNDEAEHMKTMQFCQLPGTILRAPSETGCAVGADDAAREGGAGAGVDDNEAEASRTCEGLVDCVIRAQDEPTWQMEREEAEEA